MIEKETGILARNTSCELTMSYEHTFKTYTQTKVLSSVPLVANSSVNIVSIGSAFLELSRNSCANGLGYFIQLYYENI